MQYMLLIYDNEAEMVANRKGATDVMMAEYREFTDSILKSGPKPTTARACTSPKKSAKRTSNGVPLLTAELRA